MENEGYKPRSYWAWKMYSALKKLGLNPAILANKPLYIAEVPEKKCVVCSTIYSSFDEFRDRFPMCGIAGLAKNEDGRVVFYVPCKDSFYDAWFEFDYCPGCGKSIPKE